MLTDRFHRAKAAVLVVDDSPEMQRYLRFLLEMDSYQVETVNTGLEALELLRTGFSPAVVLLDVHMPGIDGLETLRRLRGFWPDLKVIICSSEDDPRKTRQAALLGAQAYLTKPVQHLYLSAAIERCLCNSAAPSAGPSAPGRLLALPRRDAAQEN